MLPVFVFSAKAVEDVICGCFPLGVQERASSASSVHTHGISDGKIPDLDYSKFVLFVSLQRFKKFLGATDSQKADNVAETKRLV